MTKEELVKLLKEHRETTAKLKLKEKEKTMYEKRLNGCIEIENSITAAYGVNQDIHSKNQISNKVEKATLDSIQKTENMKKEAEEKIKELTPIIEELKDIVEEGNIRLEALYYKEKEIITAYYVDNREAEEIGKNLYFRLYNRTCSAENIYRIVKKATKKLLEL